MEVSEVYVMASTPGESSKHFPLVVDEGNETLGFGFCSDFKVVSVGSF